MKKIKLIIEIIILLFVLVGLGLNFLKKEKPKYSLVRVQRGEIVQEVSETGTVKMGEEINLSFKNSGEIKEIYVKTGDEVQEGQDLAKLNTVQLSIQLKEAQAALAVAQSQLEKLLAGASTEEIKIVRTAVANAQTSLENSKQYLEDTKKIAEENLDAAYEDALNVLDDSYLKSLNSFDTTKSVQLSYFTKNDQEGIKVRDSKNKIEQALGQIKFYLDKAKAEPKEENIDLALSETKKNLDYVLQTIIVIRQTCDEPLYREAVSSTDKTSLDTQKTNINTALTNVTNSQQTISSTKLTSSSNINASQAQVLTAEGNLQKAEDELSRILASPRQEDVDFYQAKTRQAEAQINLLKTQIEEATIISPVAGKITKINKRIGESIQFGQSVISLLPSNPFQVEADIYEEDIVKVKVGNSVDVKLAAFPGELFKGKLASIDPAEKIINSIVYYEVTIDFENPPQEIKPGMTADIAIKTASKENVLIIPGAAIEDKDGKKIVEVSKGKKFEEREIETGLKGSDDIIEVVSGLTEGEQILLK